MPKNHHNSTKLDQILHFISDWIYSLFGTHKTTRNKINIFDFLKVIHWARHVVGNYVKQVELSSAKLSSLS